MRRCDVRVLLNSFVGKERQKTKKSGFAVVVLALACLCFDSKAVDLLFYYVASPPVVW